MSFSVMFKRDRIRISFRANGLDLGYPDAFFDCDEFEGRRFRIAVLAYPREERFEVLIGVDYLPILHCDVAVAELLAQGQHGPIDPCRVPLLSSNRAEYLCLVHVHYRLFMACYGDKAFSSDYGRSELQRTSTANRGEY